MTSYSQPHFFFDTADYDEQVRIDAAGDLWRNYLAFDFDRNSRKSFFLRSKVWWLNDCAFVNLVTSPMKCRRPPPPDGESLISISYVRHGLQDYVLNGALQQQDPDAVHVCRHGDETIRRCYSNSEIFIFFLPTIRLGLLPDQAFPGRTFPTTTAVGSILRSVLLSLPETLGESTLEDIGTLADSICALLKPALCETADTNPIDMSCFRYTEIRSYIEDNIRDSSMDADRICTVFGISRPTLYRLFKDAGGVMAYVAGRRTHHVFTELSRSSPRWGIVKSIAEKYGFQDMTQFTRTFRRHIGTTPISVVGLSVPDMPASRNASSSGGSGQFPKPLILSKPMQQYD